MLSEALVVEGIYQSAKVFIEILHHALEVLHVIPEGVCMRPVSAAWGCVEWRVGQRHGVVSEEGLVLVAGKEITEEASEEVRPIKISRSGEKLSILVEDWCRLAGTLGLGEFIVPKQVLVKAALRRLHAGTAIPGALDVVAVELPLTRNGGAISSGLEGMAESFLYGAHSTEGLPVAKVVLTGH